jgi:hypothetical protein
MNIDPTIRPEGEEGGDLIVEELFVEDYGPIAEPEEVETAEPVTGLKKQAERVKGLVTGGRKRSVFGLVTIIGLVAAGVMLARGRRRQLSVLARALRAFRFAR